MTYFVRRLIYDAVRMLLKSWIKTQQQHARQAKLSDYIAQCGAFWPGRAGSAAGLASLLQQPELTQYLLTQFGEMQRKAKTPEVAALTVWGTLWKR